VILPGTKNTIADLNWLRQNGLEAAIKKLAAAGTPVFGVCGGYQMLGRRITDSEGVEGGGSVTGMDLLPTETEFAAEKQCTRVSGRLLAAGGKLGQLSGAAVEGYEIHMGETRLSESALPLVLLENGRFDGCFAGNVYGSYLHGLFDSAACRQALLRALTGRKPAAEVFDYGSYKQKQYDILADAVRENLDMAFIYRILEAGI
jgi:adenosylcobyric acid synthase